ncbi:hypothetical protein A3A84_04090 [Candidatus Collierbacteria bacterium RIFCSPLOWO2_01_FULL_50_23]|uniref:Uncharacterized protein n=1 Tax=Candidatus Collierbacteria bacterium RIFCSPHIGHO2_02_FULL_49_10 TaxID=1817723 RepID=A0A1F5EV23_9BACT|nr:MAG: hypothetical protein A3D09_03560 [Candidatus Collierbacteria bacterium RIFCSPHIGHO2_02_FULL_49_10]OGD73861.1 MAG: hypothetical protein A3A84_04090 [Candidatus Collierbacteria bacterium RIFCSPLOWO2_01_FULL_50_23]
MRETRRGFLKKTVVWGTVLFLGGLLSGDSGRAAPADGTFGARFDRDPSLSFAEAEQIATRINGLYGKLPPYNQEITLAWLNSLVGRFVPIMGQVGVIREPVYPSIGVVHFSEQYDFENVRARTKDCSSDLEISDRLFDPNDPWSAEVARAMAMMIHEMVHPQQGAKLCNEAGRSLIDRLALDDFERERLGDEFKNALLAVRISRSSHGRSDLSGFARNLPISLVVSGIRENRGVVDGLMLSSSSQPFALTNLTRFLGSAEAIVAGMA